MSNHRQNHAGLLERLIFNNRPVVILLCLLATLFLDRKRTVHDLLLGTVVTRADR